MIGKIFIYGPLMKIEWLIADVTSVGSPGRAERDIFGGDVGVFWPIQLAIVVGEPLYEVGMPSWALTT